MTEANTKIWEELRKPFPKETIGKMPRGGIMLDYIGHATVTDRLNRVVGPENWSLEPLSLNEDGTPVITTRKDMAVMWCKLTVMGASKVCVGTASISKFEVEKELIGDALRNGAMRFGVALDLWSKSELESHLDADSKAGTNAYTPTEPSRQLTDEPITNLTKAKLRGAFSSKGIKGADVTTFFLDVIGKEEATTEQDAQRVLVALTQ